MISLVDVLKACEGTIEPLRDGEEYFRSGHLMCVGVKEKKENKVQCIGLAAPTSGIFSYAHELDATIDLSAEDGSKVLCSKCSCVAGESEQCKHSIGMLLYLNRVQEEDLEDLTCTDLKQQWEKLKKSNHKASEAKPLCDLCHIDQMSELDKTTITEKTKNKWRNILMNCK